MSYGHATRPISNAISVAELSEQSNGEQASQMVGYWRDRPIGSEIPSCRRCSAVSTRWPLINEAGAERAILIPHFLKANEARRKSRVLSHSGRQERTVGRGER